MLTLAMEKMDRLLLWGHLKRLPAFAHSEQAYGYFWGAPGQTPVLNPLPTEDAVEVELKCHP